MGSNGLSDTELLFGAMRMGHGRAFSINAGTNSPNRVPVCKSWLNANGRMFLVEQLSYESISGQLQVLPASVTANIVPRLVNSVLGKISKTRLLPPMRLVQKARKPSKVRYEPKITRLAKTDSGRKPGLVMDYLILNQDQTDFTFQKGMTYFISGPVSLSGTTTIQGGAIIKYPYSYTYSYNTPPAWDAYLEIDGSLTTPSATDPPAICTAADDDSVGESMSGVWSSYTGVIQDSSGGGGNFDGYGSPALSLSANNTYDLENLRIHYAQVALFNYDNSVTLSDSEICGSVLASFVDDGGSSSLTCNNCLIYSNYCLVTDGGSGQFNDCTIDNCQFTIGGTQLYGSSVTADNCIFSSSGDENLSYVNGDYNGFYNSPQNLMNWQDYDFGTHKFTSATSPFTTSGNASYYLTAGSAFHNEASTGIDPNLLAELETMTTYTPQDGGYPDNDGFLDLGYHYSVDSDRNGLPDWWEWEYFGSIGVDPNADPDGDGLNNLQEYQASSSPVENDGLADPLALPPVGSSYLRIISPTVLELVRITAAGDNTWNYGGSPSPPGVNNFVVDDANPVSVGFKRRPLYQSYTDPSDTRIENSIYLTLSTPIVDNTTVKVQKAGTWNPTEWPDNVQFISHSDPLRYGPAIHVNQDGYLPNLPKKAKVGYYLGSGGDIGNHGELVVSATSFNIVDAATGVSVHSGNLAARVDTGWNTGEEQYQHVLEADFSAFTTPGTYRLQVPGLGASFPFNINDSTALKWSRTYALGLYHQRCGSGANGLQVNDMPYTRFVHNDCHVADAYVPNDSASWPDAAATIQFYNGRLACYNYPAACGGSCTFPPPGWMDGCQTAPAMCTFDNALFPLPTTLQHISTSGGHHDAGDYSKYVASSALLLHTLTFTADNIPGAANLNDLGIPESGKTTPGGPPDADLLEEAKWEADFLVKMQDTDGGFFFLVYPTGNSEYETWTPDRNQGQLIFPKNTACTAAAVAALAEIGSSPAFKARYPQAASSYITAAVNGWNFLNTALANPNQGAGNWPYSGAYQTIIPSFGGYYMHQDSLLWAAAAMFAAGQVGGQNGVVVDPHTEFRSWLDAQSTGVSAQAWHYGYGQSTCVVNKSLDSYGIPNDFGQLAYGFGCAFRDYAFAVRSGRLRPTRTVNTSGMQVTLVSGPNFAPTWTGNVKIGGITYTISGSVNATTMTLSSSAGTQTGVNFTKNGDTANLDLGALKLCENEILSDGQAFRQYSANTSYGTSFADPLKAGYNGSFYFSTDPAFALAVSDILVTTLDPSEPAYVSGHDYTADHTANVEAILENFNYQHGCNPLNVSFATGLGWKRQRQIVYQESNYPNYDERFLPPSGIPLGNISSSTADSCDFDSYFYPRSGDCLNGAHSCDPNAGPCTGSDSFALYDRWGDYHNVNRELTSFRIANALGAAAYIHSLSGAASPAWNSSPGYFTFPSGTPTTNVPTVVRLETTDSSVNLDQAQITWDVELQDQPAFGRTFTMNSRTNIGDTLVEAEAVLPDGRRVFGRQYVHFRPSTGGQELPNDGNTVALYHLNNFNVTHQLPDDSGHNYPLAVSSGFPDLFENNSWMSDPTPSSARFGAIGDEISSVPANLIPYGNLPGGTTGLTIEFELYVKRLPYLNSPLTLFSFSGQPPGNTSSQWSIGYWASLAPYPYFEAPNDHVIPNDSPAQSSSIWVAKMTPNTWHAVKITATADGLTSVYIDDMVHAVASAQNNVTWNTVTSWQLNMGNFVGCIDELRISKGVR